MTGVPHLPAEFFIAQTAADAGVAAPTDSPPYQPKPPQGTQGSLACFFQHPCFSTTPTHFSHRSLVLIFSPVFLLKNVFNVDI